MKGIPLDAQVRERMGSRESRRLRREGFIPAVLYGIEGEHILLKVLKKEFSKIMHTRSGEHSMVELHYNENGEKRILLSIIKEIQHDPVSDLIIHADFEHIDPDKPVAFVLPIEYLGTPEGVKKGGIFAAHLHELHVLCTANEAPEVIEIDINEIDLNESLHVKDISILDLTISNDPNETLAAVVRPRGLEVAEAEVEEEEGEEGEEKEGEEKEDEETTETGKSSKKTDK